MISIETVGQLRHVWARIADALSRDLNAASDLSSDPVATLRRHGFDVSADAAAALLLAIP